MRPPALYVRRLLEDHQVDRRGVYAWQHAKLTRTNSQTLDRVDSSPTNRGRRDTRRQLLPLPVATAPRRGAQDPRVLRPAEWGTRFLCPAFYTREETSSCSCFSDGADRPPSP